MPRDQAKKVLKMKVGEWQSDSNRLRIATLEAENAKLKAERDAHESLACDADDALKESEAENAKLRDLLRRVVAIEGAACDAGELEEAMASICPEIKSVIEPGNPGELGES